MTLRSIFATTFLCLALAGGAAASPPSDEGDPFAELLFPPDLVLQNQAAIALSAAQRDDLVDEVAAAQGDFIRLQAELAENGEQLKELLAETRIDEATTIATAQRMMALESKIKERHLELAIRIKNMLSAEQQELLAGMR